MKGKYISRGLTVVEVMVSSALVFILFYYIFKMLAPGMRVWMKSDIKVNLQQNTLVAMTRLTNELKESNKYSVSLREYHGINDISTLICFASARDSRGDFKFREEEFAGSMLPNGEPEWQKFIIYYLDTKSRLRRFETLSYDTLRDIYGMDIAGDPSNLIDVNDSVRNAIVGRKIETLSILYNPSEDTCRGFDIRLTAYDENDRVEEFSTTLQTTIEVRYEDFRPPEI